MKGTVKFYNESKGFGFITAEDGNEYFLHRSALKDGHVPQESESVEFEVTQGDRGPKAMNVSKQ